MSFSPQGRIAKIIVPKGKVFPTQSYLAAGGVWVLSEDEALVYSYAEADRIAGSMDPTRQSIFAVVVTKDRASAFGRGAGTGPQSRQDDHRGASGVSVDIPTAERRQNAPRGASGRFGKGK